jgi:hypothetical protein
MPELLVDFITSLDGYASAEGWPSWWGLEGPECIAWLGEQPEAATRRSRRRRGRAGDEGRGLAADAHHREPHSLPLPPDAGLVDRFRVVVFSVITGATGRERIYDGYPDVGLEMIGSRTFDGYIQLLEYVPTILDGPPGANNLRA